MSNASLSWLTKLNTSETPDKVLRRSSIIGTIGPKTNNVDVLVKLRKAGSKHCSYELLARILRIPSIRY